MEGEQTTKEFLGLGPSQKFGGKTRALAQNKVPLEKTNRNGPLLTKPVGLGSRDDSGAGAAFVEL